MKTILWIYNRPLVPEAGGTERITSLVRTGLIQCGYNCLKMLVVNPKTSEISYEGKKIDDLCEFLNKNGVDVVINQDALTNIVLNTFLSHGGAKWKNTGGKIVTCLHFDPDFPSFVKLLLSKENKTIKDFATILKFFLFTAYYNKKQKKELGKLYNELYDKSDYFVCLSELHFAFLKKVMKRNEYDKFIAINNPLTFVGISNVSVLRYKKKQVLIVARMDEFYKRISLSLKAWRFLQDMQDWSLVIVGDGPSRPNYEEYVCKHGIRRVFFVGQQSPEKYYLESSIFLMTSEKEGWGLTLTESLQRGVVPVVMNSSSVYSQIIKNGENGFLTENNNIAKFTSKIRLLMTDSFLRFKMGESALGSADNFKIEKTIELWKKIL